MTDTLDRPPQSHGCSQRATSLGWTSMNFQMLRESLESCAEERCHTHHIHSLGLPSELLNGTSKPTRDGANPPQPDSGLKCDQSAACTDRWSLFSSLVVRRPRSVHVSMAEDLGNLVKQADCSHNSWPALDFVQFNPLYRNSGAHHHLGIS